MTSFFSYEGKVARIFMRIAWACYLNLLWVLCSLPVVTMGAATSALYYVSLKIARNSEGDITRQFFSAFRENLRQATAVWVPMLAVALVLGGDLWLLRGLRAASSGAVAVAWTIVLALVICACLLWAVVAMYVFPLIATFRNTSLAMVKNSLLIGTHYLNCTLVVGAIHFAMFVVAVRFFTPILLLGEGLCAILSSHVLSSVLLLVEGTPEEAADPEGTGDPADPE